jgi:hypothetical protein
MPRRNLTHLHVFGALKQPSEELARKIADQAANRYFDNVSGIAYLDQIEVLYAHEL